MLKIRLKRLGKKKKPCYRIIAIDSRKKRDGKALKEIGFYDPLNKNTKLNIRQIQEFINKGAQLTRTVQNILKKTYD
uniref:Small ribosomal subunit protein bS16c n=1 Tax=Dipterocladia arabiensis TaxID=2007176 RepID=A0A1Z1M0R7_9FLOR|nr:ribosomal protein S16 [Dipterocladia arabiensis]ARW59480.1 ribosomal protein S16 [Dipterocladia arabiensis]